MDIDDVLSNIQILDEKNITRTIHFIEKYEQRKSKIGLDITGICAKITNETPVSITQQDKKKFKIQYKLTIEYDLSMIISVKKQKPFTIILITVFRETINRRVK